MSYSPKTYKKCNFVKLSKDPLKPRSKQKQEAIHSNYRGKVLKEWRDGWFKGHYERKQ